MASIWDDRLAEVWAPPGRAASGVVVGALGVLTARHVVASVVDGAAAGPVLARTIARGSPSAWVPMRVVDSAPAWDLAVLEVDRSSSEAAGWVPPLSPSPAVVAVGGASEDGCEAVGFPDDQVQRPEGAGPGGVVRQSEQLRGTLLPGGQAKPPVVPRPGLPRAWMPLDAATAAPAAQAGWRGMSGAGVVLPDGRLAGTVVAAEAGHQQRRLYVVPIAAALASSAELAAAMAAVAGAPVVAEARLAPRYRRALYQGCLGADGTPLRLDEVTDLGVFGVKPVDLTGEPTYLDYVPRDDDRPLAAALREAADGGRVLLVVGDSGAGKSRSAAHGARGAFPAHRLLRPVEHQLAELPHLPLADLGPAVVWLDDLERYAHPALREILGRLLGAGVAVVGTIRRQELQALTVSGEIRNPSGEALADARLTQRFDWKREWSRAERDRTAHHVASPVARQAVAAGVPLGVWAVAGPQLVHRLADAASDEDDPCRFALVRAVLDWYRTGLTVPPPRFVAADLVNRAYLGQPATDEEVTEAIDWCTRPIDIGGRRARHSLLTLQPDQRLAVNDYIQDHDRRHDPPPIPNLTWASALTWTTDVESIWGVGVTAYEAGHRVTAIAAMRVLADAGDVRGMHNLGVLLAEDGDISEAEQWYRLAAEAGHPDAMTGLGALLARRGEAAEAEQWYRRAIAAGQTRALTNLGALLAERGDPVEAEQWLRQAAGTGDAHAMHNLGLLQQRQGDADAAERWYRRAATAGYADAMANLGALLHQRGDPAQAEQWLQRAAEAGNVAGMANLGALLHERGDPAGAEVWLQRAAEGGNVHAMTNLGLLLHGRGDTGQAEHWFRRAAEGGEANAMINLGLLHHQRGDETEAEHWFQRAAEARSGPV